jgi:hypothetical protein
LWKTLVAPAVASDPPAPKTRVAAQRVKGKARKAPRT